MVGWDPKFSLVKVNPLLNWTRRDVWAFIVANHVPYNPLARPGISLDRLLAVHPAGGRRPGRARGPLGRARPRPSAGCTRWTAVNLSRRRLMTSEMQTELAKLITSLSEAKLIFARFRL